MSESALSYVSAMRDRTTPVRYRRSPIDMTLDRVQLLVVCLVVSTWNGSYMVACLGVPLRYLAFSVVVFARIGNAISRHPFCLCLSRTGTVPPERECQVIVRVLCVGPPAFPDTLPPVLHVRGSAAEGWGTRANITRLVGEHS